MPENLVSPVGGGYVRGIDAYQKASQSVVPIEVESGSAIPVDFVQLGGSESAPVDSGAIDIQLNTSAAEANVGILRQGDSIEISSQQPKSPNFASTVSALLNNRLEEIRKSEIKTKSTIGQTGNLIEVVAAVNDAEVALQQIITVRDKVVSGFMDILKMPI